MTIRGSGSRSSITIDPVAPSERSLVRFATPMADESNPLPDRPSELGGQYVLEDWLGSGARKHVYLATDQSLNAKVAVALTKLGDSERNSSAVTQREAEVMGELRDLPHVVNVFGRGEQDGFSYIILQHMAGGTVGDLCRNARDDDTPLPIADVIALGLELAEALGEIHAMGIIHCDIQPKNIWFDRPAGSLHLGDFDLAVRAGDPMSGLGEILTTCSYMAPEFTGDHVASERSDLYSLGATLYEIATGRPPFSGSDAEVERQHRETMPERPLLLRPDLPPFLDDLIMRLLSKVPGERPEDAIQVRDALAPRL